MQRVADFLGCAANTASELVSRMASKGLIEKRRSDSDERFVNLCLTDAGRLALEEHVGLDVPNLAQALARCDAQTRGNIQSAFDALLSLVGPAK